MLVFFLVVIKLSRKALKWDHLMALKHNCKEGLK